MMRPFHLGAKKYLIAPMRQSLRSCFGILKNLLWFDVWLVVQLLFGMVHWGDRIAWKILGYEKKTRYVRMGACQRSGMCCQTLAIELPSAWIRRPWVLRLAWGWYSRIHNFQAAGAPQGRLLPLNCGYLRGGNLCTIYPYRPKLCREYPATSLFGKVELHRGCGFWFLERAKVGSFGEKLAEKEHEQASLPSA
ncbi:MAG TPA: YkgJ family cysteine cluster protein [bacterium]|nr:YkgJ family cysteine cluster protein [bacterium]